MRACYYQLLLLTTLFVASGLSAVSFAAESANSLLPLVAPDPATTEQLVMYNEFSYTAAEKDAAPPAAATCCPTDVSCETSHCGCEPYWIVGVEAVWLSPQQQNSSLVNYSLSDDGALVTSLRGPIASGLFITPRLSLGFQGEKWGIQTRYWRMNESGTTIVPPEAGVANGFSYFSSCIFKAETVDVEATRLFYWRDTTNVLSFGVRYGQLNQGSSLSVSNESADGVIMSMVSSQRNFSGPGLTCGLTGLKPLMGRNFNLFYSVRGSILWDGSARKSIEIGSINVGDDASIIPVTCGEVLCHSDMFIGEMQIGAQWNFELCNHCADAFFRFALEYQYWKANQTSDMGFAINNTANDHQVIASTRTDIPRVDLIGFTVATGFTW